METLKKTAVKANRKRLSCKRCKIKSICNSEIQRECSDSFVEGWLKGYRFAKKSFPNDTITMQGMCTFVYRINGYRDR